eukprot:m.14124 g.14124  ORF g.14124 m.14124 type:complete len:63 (-) comp7514_c0_seq1:116-304(-)
MLPSSHAVHPLSALSSSLMLRAKTTPHVAHSVSSWLLLARRLPCRSPSSVAVQAEVTSPASG